MRIPTRRVGGRPGAAARAAEAQKRFLALSLLAVSSVVLAEISVVDDAGVRLRLAQSAQRIVSLAPHLTETLFAAGAGGRIVGTVDYSEYPPQASSIARVGGYSRIDLERVAALQPDLIIAWQSGNAAAHLERLRRLGVPIYLSQLNQIAEVADEIERFGVLAGSTAVASAAATSFRQRLDALQRRYANRARVPTFYQIWKQPLMTVGRKQIISDVIRLCGGDNVFGKLETMAPTVSIEAVIAANPEAIVASGMDEARPEWLDDWQRWTLITAVARGNLFFIPPDLIQRHTPRLLDGAERLCAHLETARSRRPAK